MRQYFPRTQRQFLETHRRITHLYAVLVSLSVNILKTSKKDVKFNFKNSFSVVRVKANEG